MVPPFQKLQEAGLGDGYDLFIFKNKEDILLHLLIRYAYSITHSSEQRKRSEI